MKMSPKQPVSSGRGKILRIKEGYNPNSSSVGSIVFSFPAALLAVPVLFGTVSAIVFSTFTGKKEDPSTVSDKSNTDEGSMR
jgi:hypothetical protein